jgi:hypothetical protein
VFAGSGTVLFRHRPGHASPHGAISWAEALGFWGAGMDSDRFRGILYIAAVVLGCIAIFMIVLTLVAFLQGPNPNDLMPTAPSQVQPTMDLMQTSSSPDGTWVVRVYDVNPGPDGNEIFSVQAEPTAGGTTREILLIDPGKPEYQSLQWAGNHHLLIRWRSPTSLLVGGIPTSVVPQ